MIIDKNGLTFKNLIDQEIFFVEKVDELSCHIVLENENVIVFDISSQTINNILFDSIDSAINYINEKNTLIKTS